MNELIWTKAAPTVPGQYWIREIGQPPEWIDEVTPVEIVRCQLSGEPFELFEFAGPLPKPKEPSE